MTDLVEELESYPAHYTAARRGAEEIKRLRNGVKEIMPEDLYQNIRRMKDFANRTNHTRTKWAYRWPDGGDVEVFQLPNGGKTMFKLGHDVHLAQYICDLHNMREQMIKEVESKYVVL